MPINVTCEHCQKVMKVADDMAGKRGKCPSCKNKITVPGAAPPATVPLPPPPAPPPQISHSGVSAGEPPPRPTAGPVYCPECRQEVETDPDLAGEMVACPHCNQQFQMPGKKKAKKASAAGAATSIAKDGGININISHGGGPGDMPYAARPGAGFAITGMVLAIVGCPFSFTWCTFWLALILATLGVIFSSIGLAKSRTSGRGQGMSITGLALSIGTFLVIPLSLCVAPALWLRWAGQAVVENAKQQQQININQFQQNQQKGTLKLQFAPTQKFEGEGIELFVDNVQVRFQVFAGNFSNLELAPGAHSIEIRVAGKQVFNQRPIVNAPAFGPTVLTVPLLAAK